VSGLVVSALEENVMPSRDPKRRLLNPWETADYVGSTYKSLMTMRCKQPNRIPFRKIGGKVFYLQHDLDEYLGLSQKP